MELSPSRLRENCVHSVALLQKKLNPDPSWTSQATKNSKAFLQSNSQRPVQSMSPLVVGSVAFDAVETPFGKCEKMLGGSASHFSISASFFTDVSIVGVVGGDFTEADGEVFRKHNIGTHDLERIPEGKTFRWAGRYEYDLNVA